MIRFRGKKLRRQHKWEPDVSTLEWAEKNVYMNSDASPLTGMLRFDDTPHLVEMLSYFDKPHVWKILLNWSTQTGKTLFLQIVWAKAMCTDPARMQWSIKNNKDINDYLEEKIQPFVRGVKTLQEKMIVLSEDAKKKQRAASMNVYGGGTTFTGTTDAERRSKTVKYLLMDEIALYGPGHFIELEGRTKAFERHFRKVVAVSSRKFPGDEMDVNYATCETKLEWQTYCPGCEGYFYAESKHFKFVTKSEFLASKGLTEEEFNVGEYKRVALKRVYVQCPHCDYQITNREKDQNIYDRKYKAAIVEGDENGRTVGAKANALAVRITSFETIASLLIDAKHHFDSTGEVERIEQLYLDYFNEFYESENASTESNDMLLLGNGLKSWEIPADCYKIYMGVDVQKDHFWVEVKAFCYDRVSHPLWYGRVETFADIEDVWIHGQQLEDTEGNFWQISKMGIDRRGYNTDEIRRTDEVDTFVEYMVSKYKNGDEDRVYATEGHSVLTGDKSIQVVNHKDLSSNRKKMDIKIIKMSGLYLKNILHRTITRSIKKAKGEEGAEGYNGHLFFINEDIIAEDTHSITAKSYTQQLTAEVYDYDRDKKGNLSKIKSWVRIRKDNHLWDTSVICEAFAEMDKVALAIRPPKTDFAEMLSGIAIDIHS